MNKKDFSILVVDDEEVIRNMILDYLEDDYEVICTQNANEALEVLNSRKIDLVISDINMPGIKGYELLSKIHKDFPKIKTALITAYNVDEYVRLAKQHGICNIISKTTPFNFNELKAVVNGLLSGEIFGLDRYLLKDHTIIDTFVIRSAMEAKVIREKVVEIFKNMFDDIGELKLVLDELITNAVYHAPVTIDGEEKYKEFSNIKLEPDEYVYVTLGYDSEKYGVSVLDNQGSLKKDTIMYKIDRHLSTEGILDDSGRGIHMSRIFADRLIANIDPNKKTEMLLFNYLDKNYKGYKPLYINEL